MKQQLEQRLQSLKAEFESGQKMLADLEAKQANLRDTLLRISGAIQVIEEELNTAANREDTNSHPTKAVSAEVVTEDA
ncbi:MAG TPA: hypothetical protein DDZ80_29860 [Cyanobacteria bacterium UBA8803]|nr:hypothetical protein [Cyanobacteria bacterium UBA9273]HBL62446.1 hypothetical protein [Cyanobacteria bacterium UBA8803]